MGFMGGFGFSRSQAEQDAWEVKAYQDTLAARVADHHNAMGDENFEVGEEKNAGGYKQNYRAFVLAFAAYMGIILFGYDTGLGGGVIAQPAFIRDMGITATGKPLADIKGNIVSILQGGSFFGALGAAPLSNAIGRKRSLMIGCAIFAVGGFLQTFGRSLNFQYAGRFLAGFGVGIESSVCPTYVAELAPAAIRGNITGLFQVCVVTGVALSYWINYACSFLGPNDSNAWRIPVAMQLVFVGIMSIIIPFIKESPRWLASKGRNSEACKNLAWVRLRPEDDYRVQAELAEIIAAVEADKEAMAGVSWTKEITAKGKPKRFFIAIMMFVCQQWSGQNSINYYAPEIFESIGIKGTKASLLASGVYGLVKIVATALFMAFGVERAGRKKYFVFGALGMGTFLMMIGAVFNTHPPDRNAESPSGASIGMAVLIYLFVIPYCFSWGGLVWVYISELFDTRSRAYGIAFANASQWLNNFAITKTTPLLVIAFNKGGIFFFFGALNFCNLIFSLWIPETIKLSLEQVDIVFGSVSKEDRMRAVTERFNAGAAGMAYNEKNKSVDDDEKYTTDIVHDEDASRSHPR
ncbi:hypothetical protein FFLO_02908 [Filobasidium floriforme]|uniref:Major facilitator superfamily (MFS) profile domain-containing protein n=1 Tax=Filobasidium floriforme TaxID=5210 RepID=A0A8K0NTM9_9TREE|nr:putative high-affinity glucose transporter of the major facilitator superfamily [Filobasidium floriforme]KAG7558181.1 hypothetical protein FFLO_02908 [Filobasidium floriforme]KAH8077687.1 putative high-affinity glucose transporter of the major facilitator superfamily [Filobasidium floriforme]